MTVSLLFVALVSVSASPFVMVSVSLIAGVIQLGVGVMALGGLILAALGASLTIPWFKAAVMKNRAVSAFPVFPGGKQMVIRILEKRR